MYHQYADCAFFQWVRVTATRLTTIYFIFSVVNCVVQALLQGEATVINARAADYLYDIVTAGNASAAGFYTYGNGELRYCDYVPKKVDASGCTLVWESGQPQSASSTSANGTLTMSSISSSLISATLTASSGLSTASSSPVRPISTTAPLLSTSSASTSAPASVKASATTTSAAAHASETVLVVEDDDDSDDESDADSDSNSDDDDAVLVISQPRQLQPRHGALTVLEINLNGSVDVVLDGWGYTNKPVTLSQKCVDALNWPGQEYV